VLLAGLLVGLVVGWAVERILRASGVPSLVEGTSFERTAQSLNTSTIAILARMSSWFVYVVAIFAALNIARVPASRFQTRVVDFLPQLFIAVVVVIAGFVVADKAELLVSERLKGIKLPEVTVVPALVKYSVLYVVFLVALSQVGVDTLALIALLGAYTFALVVFGALALRDFLSSGAAGVYLLLNQPYGIGDRVRIDDREGVVQGMDLLVTRIENDDEEYVVPNRMVLEHGVVRLRD
jgi:small-conductance mechanosensitive channel